MTNKTKTIMAQLDRGEAYEFSYRKGALVSTKWLDKLDDGSYCIFHYIDDSETYFSRAGIIEVLENRRSAWDGDLERMQELAKV